MENFFQLSWYRKLINNKQEVMIGYSDSSKDAGKLSASWHQYKLQEEFRNLAKKYKIDITIFSWKRWICRKRWRSNSSNIKITTTKYC